MRYSYVSQTAVNNWWTNEPFYKRLIYTFRSRLCQCQSNYPLTTLPVWKECTLNTLPTNKTNYSIQQNSFFSYNKISWITVFVAFVVLELICIQNTVPHDRMYPISQNIISGHTRIKLHVHSIIQGMTWLFCGERTTHEICK